MPLFLFSEKQTISPDETECLFVSEVQTRHAVHAKRFVGKSKNKKWKSDRETEETKKRQRKKSSVMPLRLPQVRYHMMSNNVREAICSLSSLLLYTSNQIPARRQIKQRYKNL